MDITLLARTLKGCQRQAGSHGSTDEKKVDPRDFSRWRDTRWERGRAGIWRVFTARRWDAAARSGTFLLLVVVLFLFPFRFLLDNTNKISCSFVWDLLLACLLVWLVGLCLMVCRQR